MKQTKNKKPRLSEEMVQ